MLHVFLISPRHATFLAYLVLLHFIRYELYWNYAIDCLITLLKYFQLDLSFILQLIIF